MSILGETEDDSHIVSPAVADDSNLLECYLSPTANNSRRIRTHADASRSGRPVVFRTALKRPVGMAMGQSLAAQKCEIIEKLLEPHAADLINLYFQHADLCFPVFDEASFRNLYTHHKSRLSSALLATLYAQSVIYWESSSTLRQCRCPDGRFIWNQANEALCSEVFLAPGTSTVIATILNVGGRPSTSLFGNGGLVGTAVALSHALGLHRDPSAWDIPEVEKLFRKRVWWLVFVHDRWCSLAYGTPLLISRNQYDVPLPTVQEIYHRGHSTSNQATASIFVALVSLTGVLGELLETVYQLTPSSNRSPTASSVQLERCLTDWEGSLPPDIRRLVLRGTSLTTPGSANLRLCYLAVRLLLRRSQIHSASSIVNGIHAAEHWVAQAQLVAEDIVCFVLELSEFQCRDFWLPVNAFTLTSATMFLLKATITSNQHSHSDRELPLRLAKDMLRALRDLRLKYLWDLADDCLAKCEPIVEKIDSLHRDCSAVSGMQDGEDTVASLLDDLFPLLGNPCADDFWELGSFT